LWRVSYSCKIRRRWLLFRIRVRCGSSRRHSPIQRPAVAFCGVPGRCQARPGSRRRPGPRRTRRCSPGCRAAGLAAPGPGGPAAADDVAVPAQDRVRGDQQPRPWRRAWGITPGRAASRARSARFTSGRRGCRRCSTAGWRRRIKISAVCHVFSRRDSRSHEATRVIRRKTNRGHMTGDHHGRTARSATLLVRAMDGILGRHRSPFRLIVSVHRRSAGRGGGDGGHSAAATTRASMTSWTLEPMATDPSGARCRLRPVGWLGTTVM
jgi:hypothetical protein